VKRAAALFIATALAVGTAGCGGGGGSGLSKSRYEAKMRSIVQPLDSTLSKLRSFAPTNIGAADDYFQGLAGTFYSLSRQLGQIKPPKDVQALHTRLTDAAGKAADVFQALAQRLRQASPAERQRILADTATTERLLSALNGVERTANALAAKGYRFSSSAGTRRSDAKPI
jgi:hypothetical protein